MTTFYEELRVLCEKYGVTISGCGCCGSPTVETGEDIEIGLYACPDYVDVNSHLTQPTRVAEKESNMYPIRIYWVEASDGVLSPAMPFNLVSDERTARFYNALPEQVPVTSLDAACALLQSLQKNEIVLHDPSTCAPFGELGVHKVMCVPIADRVTLAFYWMHE